MKQELPKQELPKPEIKKEKVVNDLPAKSSTGANSNSLSNSSKKSNFVPHNYGSTDFTKYHNQSKDVLYIAKRLQQVNILEFII